METDIRRVCMYRKIDAEEERAMVEMFYRVLRWEKQRPTMLPALCFWKVCQFSKKYQNQFSLWGICRSHL